MYLDLSLPLSLCLPTVLPQARRELKRLKKEARRRHAVAVIWAYWLGLKVPAGPPRQGQPGAATRP